jgi:hypothetical protein
LDCEIKLLDDDEQDVDMLVETLDEKVHFHLERMVSGTLEEV